MLSVTIEDAVPNGFSFEEYFFDLWELTNLDDDDPTWDALLFPTDIAVFDNITGASFTANGNFQIAGGDLIGGEINRVVLVDVSTTYADFEGFDVDVLDFIDAYDAAVFNNNRGPLEALFDEPVTFNGSIRNDVLTGFGDDDIFRGDEGADTFLGRGGSDTADYSGEDGGFGVVINLNIGTSRDTYRDNDVFSSIENVTGSSFDDRIFGDGQANVFLGNAGVDSLNGKDGDDTISGGSGNDVLVGGAGDDDIDGDDGDDRIGGRTGDDDIDGGAGDDVIVGQLGDDDIDGGIGDDRINGGVGDDEIDAGDGDDVVLGRSDDDEIDGGAGDDALNGGSGEDRLEGGLGNDQLIGGADADVFVFASSGYGDDEIVRFQDGLDIIEIGSLAADDFADLSISQVGSDAVIVFGGGSITVLDRNEGIFTAADFDFV